MSVKIVRVGKVLTTVCVAPCRSCDDYLVELRRKEDQWPTN